MFYKIVFLILCLFSIWLCLKADSIKDQMYADLDIIKHAFEVKYAPTEWKNLCYGWNLNEQIEKTKKEIANTENITLKEFHRILARLFNSPRDYHVNISFYSTEFSAIPMRLQSV